jgi:hypothetical protein
VQIARDVSGTAADVGHHAPAARVFCKPIEKMAVERLACQLGRKMLRVGFGCGVVAVANIHPVKVIRVVLHSRSKLIPPRSSDARAVRRPKRGAAVGREQIVQE